MHGSRIGREGHRDGAARSPAVTPAAPHAARDGGVRDATSAVMRLQAVAGNRATAGAIARMRAGDASRGSGILQRLAYDDPPDRWGAVTIARSAEGRDGVYLVDLGTERIVVKPVKAAAPAEYAGKVMQQAMGLDAPRTRTYTIASTEGQQIAALLTAGTVKDATPKQTQDAIDDNNYFLVMSNVEGVSIQRLDDGGATAFIRDDGALNAVGRIMVADAFLGNDDRLIGGPLNLGNFFYAVATATVGTVDNASRFKPAGGTLTPNLKTKLGEIEKLIDTTTRFDYIDDFCDEFRARHDKRGNTSAVAAYDARVAAAKAAVSHGITAGLHDLAEVFRDNIDLVRAVAFSRERESKDERSPDVAKGVAHYIRARQLEGTNKADAVSQLTDYLKYRDRRNKALPGMKWVTKIYSDVGFSFS